MIRLACFFALVALAALVPVTVNLNGQTVSPVAEIIEARGLPFIFATGYGERAPIPDELASAPVIQKPYTREVVESAIAKLK